MEGAPNIQSRTVQALVQSSRSVNSVVAKSINPAWMLLCVVLWATVSEKWDVQRLNTNLLCVTQALVARKYPSDLQMAVHPVKVEVEFQLPDRAQFWEPGAISRLVCVWVVTGGRAAAVVAVEVGFGRSGCSRGLLAAAGRTNSSAKSQLQNGERCQLTCCHR